MFGVDLYTATRSTSKIAFNQIHEPSGKRIRYEKVAEGIGPVDADDIVKGYEYEKGHYVLLTDEELEDVRIESKKTFELTQFVEAKDIDPIYFERPYFVSPQDDLAEDAFRVVRDALRSTGKVGLGQITLRGREYIAALKSCGHGMVLETLRYQQELQKAEGYFRSISAKKADKDMLDLATTIIERRTGPFEASTFKDHYEDALHALIEAKIHSRGKKVKAAPEEKRPSGGNVVDLMSALRQSLDAKSRAPAKGKAKAPAAKSKPRKAAPRRAAAKAQLSRRKRAAR
jgi:DNA end-binding protein Ku